MFDITFVSPTTGLTPQYEESQLLHFDSTPAVNKRLETAAGVHVDVKAGIQTPSSRVEPVVIAARHFNVHRSLITVLASNISRVSVQKCDADGS